MFQMYFDSVENPKIFVYFCIKSSDKGPTDQGERPLLNESQESSSWRIALRHDEHVGCKAQWITENSGVIKLAPSDLCLLFCEDVVGTQQSRCPLKVQEHPAFN